MKTLLGWRRARAALIVALSALTLSACHYHGHGGYHGYGYGKGPVYRGGHGHYGGDDRHAPRYRRGR